MPYPGPFMLRKDGRGQIGRQRSGGYLKMGDRDEVRRRHTLETELTGVGRDEERFAGNGAAGGDCDPLAVTPLDRRHRALLADPGTRPLCGPGKSGTIGERLDRTGTDVMQGAGKLSGSGSGGGLLTVEQVHRSQPCNELPVAALQILQSGFRVSAMQGTPADGLTFDRVFFNQRIDQIGSRRQLLVEPAARPPYPWCFPPNRAAATGRR